MKLIFRKVQTWWGKDGKKHSTILPALKLSPSPFIFSSAVNRREFAKRGALTIAAAGLAGPAFTAPSCGASKEKAVRYTGLVIEIAKEAVPLMDLLGGHDIATLMRDKVIPTLEKLKDVLAEVNIPDAATTLETVRASLSSVATALLALPDTARRTTIIGILASINVLLLTVEAFVESEAPASAMKASMAKAASSRSTSKAIMQVFQASRN